MNALLKNSLLLACLFLAFEKGSSQPRLAPKTQIGFAGTVQVDADGYGMQFLPAAYLKKGKRSFFIAPTLQREKWTFSGAQACYEYSVTGPEVNRGTVNELELFFFIQAAYHQNAVMGERTKWEEEMTNPACSENSIQCLHFRSVEVFAGAGLAIPFLKRFKWKNSFGLGYYHSFYFPHNLYYEGSNVGLVLKTGISMDLKKPR